MRGGEMRMKPSEYKFINAPTNNIRDAIYQMEFDGPSSVLFQTMEFLLGAAKDITAVKDVLTGEAPPGQAEGATLALIEQGLQVFSTIYTRIYRSMRKELKLLFKLNRRYMDPKVYADFLDDRDLMNELLQQTGNPQAAMSAVGVPAASSSGPPTPPGAGPSPMPGGPAPQGATGPMPPSPTPPDADPSWTPEALQQLLEDFDLKGMDLAPSADPKSVTDMQRMMRAQLLQGFIGQPGINSQEIQKRIFEAANIEDIDKLFLPPGSDPMQQLNVQQVQAKIANEKSSTILNMAKAEETNQKASGLAFERGVNQGTMVGGLGGMDNAPPGQGVPPSPGGDGGPDPSGMAGLSGQLQPGAGGPLPSP